MLLVDSREGSKNLVAPLKRAGLPVAETTLEFGDLAFLGRGEGGAEVAIGVEHKTVADCLDSLMSERLAGHQLPGLVRDYDRAYLIIEGERRSNAQGQLLRGSHTGWRPYHGAPNYVEFLKRLLVLQMRGGLTLIPTVDRAESVLWLTALYRVWTDADMDEHKSHLALYTPDLDRQLLVKPSKQRIALAAWPGIGFERSAAVEHAFGSSIRKAVFASAQTWAAIETNGRKLGLKTAEKIQKFLDGGEV